MSVQRLPVESRLCGDCTHGYLGELGVYCLVFHELIADERVAEECEEWRSR